MKMAEFDQLRRIGANVTLSLRTDRINNSGASVVADLEVWAARVADRLRLSSWGAGRGADRVWRERRGGASCCWRSAQTVVVMLAWSGAHRGE